MFTQEEKNFIINILAQTKVNPAQEDALLVVNLVQSVIKKLTAPPMQDEQTPAETPETPVENAEAPQA